MSGIISCRNGYKMDKNCKVYFCDTQPNLQQQQMEIDNEIYIIDSSDEDIPNVESSNLSAERINDIIIGDLNFNKRNNSVPACEIPLSNVDDKHCRIKATEHFLNNDTIYLSDDSSDSLHSENLSNGKLDTNFQLNDKLDKKLYANIKPSSAFNFNYEKLTIPIAKLSNESEELERDNFDDDNVIAESYSTIPKEKSFKFNEKKHNDHVLNSNNFESNKKHSLEASSNHISEKNPRKSTTRKHLRNSILNISTQINSNNSIITLKENTHSLLCHSSDKDIASDKSNEVTNEQNIKNLSPNISNFTKNDRNKSKTDMQNKKNKLSKKHVLTSINKPDSTNYYCKDDDQEVTEMCKLKLAKNLSKQTISNNQNTSCFTIKSTVSNNNTKNNYSSSKSKNICHALISQLDQFECENTVICSSKNCEDTKNDMKGDVQMQPKGDTISPNKISTDKNEENVSFNEQNYVRKSLSRTNYLRKNIYKSCDDNIVSSEDKEKSDIQIRLNFVNGNQCVNNQKIEKELGSETYIATELKTDLDTVDNQIEKNDIFDYLKLDKRKPNEIRQDLENKKKNLKRRSLRVERLKQIQENAKELLKLRKANEANEADECPNDLINESIVQINSKNTCNVMPVLEPVLPVHKLPLSSTDSCQTNGTASYTKNDPDSSTAKVYFNNFDNKSKELFLKKKYKSITKNITRKCSAQDDNLLKVKSDESDAEDTCTRKQKIRFNNKHKFKSKNNTMQLETYIKPVDNNHLVERNKPYKRLNTLRVKGANKYTTTKEFIKPTSENVFKTEEENNSINVNKALADNELRSLDIFDKFSNKIYCDILLQSPNSNSNTSITNEMKNGVESSVLEKEKVFSGDSSSKTAPVQAVDLIDDVKLTTSANNEEKINTLNNINCYNRSTRNKQFNQDVCTQTNKIESYQTLDKMPRLEKMVDCTRESYIVKNKNELNNCFSNDIRNNKLQISSTTIVENDNLNTSDVNILNIECNSNFDQNKFYNKICLSQKDNNDKSLNNVQNNNEDEIESFFIRGEIVIIVRQKTIHFYEHSIGFKFFRSPKLWQYKGYLMRYANDLEKKLIQITNQVTFSDEVTAYTELWVKPRKLSSTHSCPVCDMSAVIYHYKSSNEPEKSILHLDYAQCSVKDLCFTILPFDRAIVVGYVNTLSDDHEFIVKKYLMPKQYSSNKDIISLPSVNFKCTNLQAVNADVVLGFNTDNIVFWHHGYETILQIVKLSSIPKSICSEDFSFLFCNPSQTQCVWARLDTTCSKRSAMHILVYQSELNVFALLTASKQDWTDFKILHTYQLSESFGSLQSVSISGCRVVAAFAEGAITYDFPLLPYEMQDEHAMEVGKALNVCTYGSSTIYPSGEMVVYYKNNTAVPLLIDQL